MHIVFKKKFKNKKQKTCFDKLFLKIIRFVNESNVLSFV